jgi:hypothetical protein
MIKCEIIHTSFRNPLKYVAISYAWGDAGDTRKIEIGRFAVPVAVSLHGALKALRQKSTPVLLWIDAFCIDQQNQDERTQQVKLMASIYSTAESVAIWLDPEEDDNALAIDLLHNVAAHADSPDDLRHMMTSQSRQRDLPAAVALFERDYWNRLWIVQEIFNAASITVYCGLNKIPWRVYQLASEVFSEYKLDVERRFPFVSFNYSEILSQNGLRSLPDLKVYLNSGSESLLEVLHANRRKMASDARDKLYGVLGVLPEHIRKEFRADYTISVKEVYTGIVDYLLKTTERLDVICEAVHFPAHSGPYSLPSYVPDWSHLPQTAPMGRQYAFFAGLDTNSECRFLDDRLNKLEISAIYLDTIRKNGVAVGTLCTLADYLMAFLHWRAMLLKWIDEDRGLEGHANMKGEDLQQEFCETISPGQVPSDYKPSYQWLHICYRVFASLLRERLPHLPLDQELADYVHSEIGLDPESRRKILQQHLGDRMMGRCFCLTQGDRIGMGSGMMHRGDIIVVPLGCRTPIILRKEGNHGEYRFVGDVYVSGYMYGKSIEQLRRGERILRSYTLH